MTIATIYAPVVTPVSGAGPYQFGWEVIDPSHIVVSIDEVIIDASQYTVSLNGQGPIYVGGSVTFLSAPTGAELVIARNTNKTQQVDLTAYGPFPAESNEFALDKLTLIVQENALNTGDGGGTQPPSGGPYLPLAGGTMNAGALISWPAPGGLTNGGNFGLISFLGKETFAWSPANTSTGEIAFAWGAAEGKVLDYNLDGRFSLTLTGRTETFTGLLDNDVLTKKDVANMDNINSLAFVHQTDEVAFGSILMGYASATLAGVAGGQALVFSTTADSIYQGYKFVTENSDGSKWEVDIAGGGVWSDRQQDGGANAPLLDQLVSRRWVENFGPGGVEEAPNDGNEYVRQNEAWAINTGGSGVEEAPNDGQDYVRSSEAWKVLPAAGSVVWGDIGGTLSNQLDLQAALDAKADVSNTMLLSGNQTASGTKTFSTGIVVTGAVSSIAVNCTTGGVAAIGFNAGAARIQNVGAPSATTDATTKTYVDSGLATKSNTTHGHAGVYAGIADTNVFTGVNQFNNAVGMSAGLLMNSTRIQGVGTPTAANDATPKSYVDGLVAGLQSQIDAL